jgi:hypothetical protein
MGAVETHSQGIGLWILVSGSYKFEKVASHVQIILGINQVEKRWYQLGPAWARRSFATTIFLPRIEETWDLGTGPNTSGDAKHPELPTILGTERYQGFDPFFFVGWFPARMHIFLLDESFLPKLATWIQILWLEMQRTLRRPGQEELVKIGPSENHGKSLTNHSNSQTMIG